MSHKHRPFQDLEHALDARGGDPDAWGDHVEEVGRTAVAAGRAAPATPRPLEVLVAHHALGWPVFDGIHDDFPDEDPDAEGWVFRATYEDNGEEAWQSARRMNEEDGCGWVDYTELAERLNSWSGLGFRAAFLAALRALGVPEEEIQRAAGVSDEKEGAP